MEIRVKDRFTCTQWGFFPMDFRVKSLRAWRCRKRAKPCFEKSRGGVLNKTTHKQILNARDTKTSLDFVCWEKRKEKER